MKAINLLVQIKKSVFQRVGVVMATVTVPMAQMNNAVVSVVCRSLQLLFSLLYLLRVEHFPL